jgi:DMSO/TMAO reductase YedYZ molybdopterin-dependent catalytic subunit
VRLADLAAQAGAPAGFVAVAESLQRGGRFRQTTLGHAQASDERALLALRVNGADLSLDHGYPARLIVPALPGVHCTKWVSRLTFARS